RTTRTGCGPRETERIKIKPLSSRSRVITDPDQLSRYQVRANGNAPSIHDVIVVKVCDNIDRLPGSRRKDRVDRPTVGQLFQNPCYGSSAVNPRNIVRDSA